MKPRLEIWLFFFARLIFMFINMWFQFFFWFWVSVIPSILLVSLYCLKLHYKLNVNCIAHFTLTFLTECKVVLKLLPIHLSLHHFVRVHFHCASGKQFIYCQTQVNFSTCNLIVNGLDFFFLNLDITINIYHPFTLLAWMVCVCVWVWFCWNRSNNLVNLKIKIANKP